MLPHARPRGARVLALVLLQAACGSSGSGGDQAGAQSDASDATADGGDGNASTDSASDGTALDSGRSDSSTGDARSDGAPHGEGGITSCTGQADGTTIPGGQICCVAQPIPATANGRCPALFHGSANGVSAAPIVGGAATPTGRGYWLVARDGGVFTYGDAAFKGSLGGKGIGNIVGMAADTAGDGYWLVGADGGVFSFGSAPFGGSLPGMGISVGNIVGIAANPSGSGYWLAGKDGKVYALGGAPAATSAPGVGNVVGIAANPAGTGYWLAGADGGIFALNGAPFDGSLPGMGVSVTDVVGIAANPEGHGYWLVGADGGVFTFGSSNYFASAATGYSSSPVVAMTASAGAYGYWMIAADGEVFVAPNAPPESTAEPPIGTSEAYLGQKGSFALTVWDASGQRNCNEGPFAQIPGDATHVIGRYNNTCGNGPWSLARWTVDWTQHRLTFANMIFDTRGGSVPISGGNALSTYYDATIVSYAGELWVAGECGGSIAGAGTASACVGPLSSTTWTMDPARTGVAILGNQSLGDGWLYSASVPKLLVFQGGLYLYWSAVKIAASGGTWSAITERGTQLAEFPPSGGGMLWAARTGGAIGARDPNYTDEVWGLGTTTADDVVADIGGIFTDGTSVYANGSIAGTACSMPFWPPTCYALAFAKSANPLGNDIFDTGTLLPATSLTTSPGGELRLFTDPGNVDYLWGSYFTNVTGPRPMPLTGSPNIGYLMGYAIPQATPFFGSL
jgi:hypothetical protein